jgi:phospholipid/cholesterol/gamma-HCH transport system substrate-binding protein
MRRFVYLGLIVALLPWVVIGIVRAATDDETKNHYMVRAIFDNASTLVAGEDVKVAGAPVGVISSMDVTEDKKAAVTLRIDDEGFTPFKRDASCTIRLQGLIGERFVECEPGSAGSPALAKIDEGPGKGERLLPVANTSSPVDLDLLNDILRLPYRQRFAILLNELGTGLAGRGTDLNEVIHRANPALRETDKVLAILAGQNRDLARLARDSDQALAPLSRERAHFAHFIVAANETGQATAERRGDIALGIHRLPEFLRQLRSLMVDLEGLSDQGTPLLSDLGDAAPDLGRLIKAQGTLADASRDAFPSLGEALRRGRPALIHARPLIQDLEALGQQLAPVSINLDDLTKSLDKTGAVQRINDFLYYLALATNGFDSLSHYLRAGLVTNTCTEYATVPTGVACTANFTSSVAANAADGAKPLQANLAPEPKKGASGGNVPPTGTLLRDLLSPASDPSIDRQREANMRALRRRASQPSPGMAAGEPMLDYLLGGSQ